MKILPLICRIFLGLIFIVFGLNVFFHFIPMQAPPPDSLPGQFMAVMIPTGWMNAIGVLQIGGGLLVLLGGTTPLGLIILGPIIVNILLFHICLTNGKGIGMGVFAAVLEILLVHFYRSSFVGIITGKAQPTIKAPAV
jgi:putative oxidoreductase